jgi:hypothetical protein
VELTLLPIATTRSCFTLQIKLAINSETSAKYFMIYYISTFREKWPLQGTPQTILQYILCLWCCEKWPLQKRFISSASLIIDRERRAEEMTIHVIFGRAPQSGPSAEDARKYASASKSLRKGAEVLLQSKHVTNPDMRDSSCRAQIAMPSPLICSTHF